MSFMHISLDGFVAGPNGEMNWIKVDEEIFEHIGKRIAQTDTSLYGRVTYDMMEGYWPTAGDAPDASAHDKRHASWYKSVHKVVLSRSMQGTEVERTTIISDDIAARIDAVKQEAGSEILLFGSPTATHALMQLGLIDGYWLFVNPVILGAGIPLFSAIREKTKLRLETSRTFAAGVTELSYAVNRD
ncbi:MAG: dihydrofolate reductase [Sphingobacteriales bacterium]|nr:MAG: dihydrofolate reductase [Sphingobacteriales bacterium]